MALQRRVVSRSDARLRAHDVTVTGEVAALGPSVRRRTETAAALVEVDAAVGPPPRGGGISSTSGRFWKLATGILNSSIAPWIVFSAAALPGSGRRSLGFRTAGR